MIGKTGHMHCHSSPPQHQQSFYAVLGDFIPSTGTTAKHQEKPIFKMESLT